MLRQEYSSPPQNVKEVRGASSQTIYFFMTGALDPLNPKYYHHPWDVDDWERNRALLLCFPEWKARLPEMSALSSAWKNLAEDWSSIEKMYEREGGNIYGGKCCQFIKFLVKL